MKRALILTGALALVLVGSQSDSSTETTDAPEVPTASAPEPEPAETVVTYAQIEAITAKCIGCHGEQAPKEDLDLRTYAGLMKGSEHGAVVIPGDAENSMLVHSLRGTHGKKQMPMMANPLPEEEIALVEAWIQAGAKE